MTYCRKCHEFADTSEELKNKIENYILGIDKDNRTSEEIYKNRLIACERCEKLINGVCSFCGCFVLIRAAMIDQSCSNPKNDLWKNSKS